MFSPRNIYSSLPDMALLYLSFPGILHSSTVSLGNCSGRDKPAGNNRKTFSREALASKVQARHLSKKLEACSIQKSDELCKKNLVAPRKPKHRIDILSGIPGLQFRITHYTTQKSTDTRSFFHISNRSPMRFVWALPLQVR